MKNNKFPFFASLLFSTLLSACGGGSGGSASNANTNTAGSAVSVSNNARQFNGVVAKGRIAGGRVLAYNLDQAGNKSATSFASTITGGDGAYSISLPGNISSFIIEVSAAPGALMYDEATQSDLPFPEGLILRSVVKQGANPEPVYWGSVTPLTELIVQLAENAGGLTATNIDRTRAGVQAMLGFDPQRVSAIHTTADTSLDTHVDEKIQGLSLTAISQLALDKAFACDANTQGARVVCVVRQIANAGKLEGGTLNLRDDVRLALRASLEKVAGDENLNKSGKSSVAGVSTFTNSSLPAPVPEADKIAVTKQLFGSLRSNIYAVSNAQKNGGLDLRLNAVKTDFEKAIAPLDKDLLVWSKTITEGIDQFNKYRNGQTRETAVNGLFYGQTALWSGYQNIGDLGDCTVMRDAMNVATTPAQAAGIECRFSRFILPGTYKYSYKYQVEWVELVDRIWLEPIANDVSRFNYRSELVQQKAVFVWNEEKNDFLRRPVKPADAVAMNGNSNATYTGQMSFAMEGNKLYAFTVEGKMPPRTNSSGQLISDFESWSLRTDRNQTVDGNFRYDFSGELKSYVKDQVSSRLALDKGSYAIVALNYKGNLQKNGVKEFKLAITAEAANSKVHGEIKIGNASSDKNGVSYQPNRIDFVGSISSATGLTNALEIFNGQLTVERFAYNNFDSSKPESANNFVRKAVALSGVVQVPERPSLKLNVTASNDAFGSNSILAQYMDGSSVINAQMSESLSKPRIVRVSSSSGVSFDVFGSNEVADILQNGSKVGWLDIKAGRISYVDGSFETIR
jgi:hypothetical protein